MRELTQLSFPLSTGKTLRNFSGGLKLLGNIEVKSSRESSRNIVEPDGGWEDLCGLM